MTRCKKGDLAVIVQSFAGNEGKFVTCIRLATENELRAARFRMDIGPVWLIDRPLKCSHGLAVPYSADRGLRPIRPGEISDEEVRDLYLPKLPEVA